MPMLTTSIPLTLYIHMPWCLRKCPYCDFNSYAVRGNIPQQAYVNALLQDLDQDLSKTHDRPLLSIFIGGGTPSLFSPEHIHALLKGIQMRCSFSNDLEITLEANPGTIDYQNFSDFREAGINRLSLGIQSFQNEKLQMIERIHDANEAKRAIEAAQCAGFNNINCDLMYGLPHQQPSDALLDLEIATEYKLQHISWYQLTIEPNTSFYRKSPSLPDDKFLWEIETNSQNYLRDKGYKQYEVSAYCQKEYKCKHNMNYWEFGDYLGIGAGAHSKLTDFNAQKIKRYWKHKNPKKYLQADVTIEGSEIIQKQKLPLEFMLNALRLQKPIPIKLFESRTGLHRDTILKTLNQAEKEGFLQLKKEIIYLTIRGKRFLNTVLELFC